MPKFNALRFERVARAIVVLFGLVACDIAFNDPGVWPSPFDHLSLKRAVRITKRLNSTRRDQIPPLAVQPLAKKPNNSASFSPLPINRNYTDDCAPTRRRDPVVRYCGGASRHW